MPDSLPTTRTYSSALRDAQAARTRESIHRAAAAVFGELGYAAATLAAIARRAGVSVESVKAAGPKPALLLAAFETMFGGSAGPQPFASRADLESVRALPQDEFLATMLGVVADANARAGGLWLTFLGAARSDALVAEALDDIVARRANDYRALVDLVAPATDGSSEDREDLVHSLLVVMSIEARELLVTQSGWSQERYFAWLHRSVRELIDARRP